MGCGCCRQRDIPEGFEWWYSDAISYRGPRRNLPPEPSRCHDPVYAGVAAQELTAADPAEPSQPRRSRASVRDKDPASDSDDDPPQNIIDQPPEYPRGRSPQSSPQSKESYLHGTGAGASYAPLLPEDLGMPPRPREEVAERERERETYKDLDIDELELLRGNLQANISEDLLVRFLRGYAEEPAAARGQLAPVQEAAREAPAEAEEPNTLNTPPGLPATSLPRLGPGLPKSGLLEDPYATWQYPQCSFVPSTLWAGTVTAYCRPEEVAREFVQGTVTVPEEAEASQLQTKHPPSPPASPSASLERVHSDMTALTEALQARQRRWQSKSSPAAVSLKFTAPATAAAWVQKPWSKAQSPSGPNRLQITVSHAIGNTTEAFLSCEVAGQRRQVSLDQLLEVGPGAHAAHAAQAAQALRLPAVTASMELTLLSRLGHAALVLHPGVATYSLELETPSSPSRQRRSLDLHVSPASGLYDSAGVVEQHKRYLEKLIQAVLSARPAEPFEYMARQVRNLRLQEGGNGGRVHGPCDLRVLGAEGLPPETLLTVRCGSGEGRQAQLSHLLEGRKRLKIPDGPLLQVNFLLPESAAHLPTSLGLQEVHFPRQGEILGLRVRVAAAAEGASPQLSSRMQSVSAEEYLCQHKLLPFAQGLLQNLVKAPGSFLVDLEARLRAKAQGSQEASAA